MDLPIPICKPLLPPAESILPYMSRIDASRIYSNFGPLVREFEARFAQLCGVEGLKLVTAANGTLAIQAALVARCNPANENRKLCLLPAFTFAGTVSAVIGAGLEPMFVDVDPTSCVIDLDQLAGRRHPASHRRGRDRGLIRSSCRTSPAARHFEARTGIPVIVDAAGCSDALLSGAIKSLEGATLALSFHATKAFGIGEGGAVATTDRVAGARHSHHHQFRSRRQSLARLPGSTPR